MLLGLHRRIHVCLINVTEETELRGLAALWFEVSISSLQSFSLCFFAGGEGNFTRPWLLFTFAQLCSVPLFFHL